MRVLAQERAVKALTFGMGLGGLDFNIYVAGPSKTGLTYITRTLVEEEAKKKAFPGIGATSITFNWPINPRPCPCRPAKGRDLKRTLKN